MSAIELLSKAIELDAQGQKLKALKLYADGIAELRRMYISETNPAIKYKIEQLIKENDERARLLNNIIELRTSKGEIIDQILILDGSKRYSYETIFDKYLDSTITEITIEEPYLKMNYQLYNLVTFCELLVSKCTNLKFIRVITTKGKQIEAQQITNISLQPSVQLNEQQRTNAFQQLLISLKELGIEITYEVNDKLHHRQIILSNGYVIKICRGLHYFKPTNYHSIGAFNQNFRECLQTNIDVLFCPEIKK